MCPKFTKLSNMEVFYKSKQRTNCLVAVLHSLWLKLFFNDRVIGNTIHVYFLPLYPNKYIFFVLEL